jgi:hypothetical protein
LNRSRISIAKPEIVDYFTKKKQAVYSFSELEDILETHRPEWKLAITMSSTKFVNFLIDEEILQVAQLDFLYKPVIRYYSKQFNIFNLLESSKPKAFFSHKTALKIHGLSDNIEKEIFLNEEQAKKSDHSSEISQGNIDTAFKRPQRKTTNIFEFNGYKITLVNGMNTNNLGVVEMMYEGFKVRTTDIPRTLIDIVVRPNYSGSEEDILNVYKKASNEFSIFQLADYLKKINYVYPYHQCIGFYMEASGAYSDVSTKLFLDIGIKYDFYLSHNISSPKFCKKWGIYYPSEIDELIPSHMK